MILRAGQCSIARPLKRAFATTKQPSKAPSPSATASKSKSKSSSNSNPTSKPSTRRRTPHDAATPSNDAGSKLETSLAALKLDPLRRLASSTGISSSETKAALCRRLSTELLQPRLGNTHTTAAATAKQDANLAKHEKSKTSEGEHYRLLSIDMGIRNLAFAILDVSLPSTSTSTSPFSAPLTHPAPPLSLAHTTLQTWRRLTLSPPSFTPSSLAPLAHALTQQHLLPAHPTHILIERQRHRSGGGAAVLEWTVRVNALESALWGVLVASASAGNEGVSLREVSPARVGSFWVSDDVDDDNGGGSAGMKGKKEREKEKKIKVVEGWLRGTDGGQGALRCSGQAAEMQSQFLGARDQRNAKTRKSGATQQKRRKEGDAKSVMEDDAEGALAPTAVHVDSNSDSDISVEGGRPGKLDDLADCLLQGMAWVEWEMNRRRVVAALSAEVKE